MRARSTIVLPLVFFHLFTVFGSTAGEEPGIAGTAADTEWMQDAASAGLTQPELRQLEALGIVAGDEEYRQIFTPYIDSDLPVFITSDSVLTAFHILFARSIYSMERSAASRLPEMLRFLWKELVQRSRAAAYRAPAVQAALVRAQVTVGVALRLLGARRLEGIEEEISLLVESEVKKVEKGVDRDKPTWLGERDPGFMFLDYSRYVPRGFYTDSQALMRYFRALSWLQSIPFRLHEDGELLSALILGDCLNALRIQESGLWKDVEKFFSLYQAFLGLADDWNLVEAACAAEGGLELDPRVIEGFLARKREWILDTPHFDSNPRVNDQVRTRATGRQEPAEPSFRILSAYRIPDSVLFQRTTAVRPIETSFPTGLEILIALGSGYARSRFEDPVQERVLRTIDASLALFEGDSLYFDYLHCLAVLLDAPDPGTPPFMKSPAWQAKSCQTALASWAQMRHTWILQAKQSVVLGCRGDDLPLGFVEPAPRFFRRLAALALRTRTVLDEADLFRAHNQELARQIRTYLQLLEEKQAHRKRGSALDELSPAEQESFRPVEFLMFCVDWGDQQYRYRSPQWYEMVMERLATLADDLDEGQLPQEAELHQAVIDWQVNLESLWQKLESLCEHLESLARRQLEGQGFNEDDKEFITKYGQALAELMLYQYNSWVAPLDDAPRIADICANPWHTDGWSYLEAGVGRPRALYVLYPWGGCSILCRGAIVPYFEFTSAQRLTDESWKARLDSPNHPKNPSWTDPLYPNR